MRKFYLFQKRQTLSIFLSWSHYIELLSLKDKNEINYYIKLIEQQNLGVRKLREKIKSKEYERLDNSTKERLINNKKNKIGDFIKHPIIVKNTSNYETISEKLLRKLILEDI